MSSMAAALFQQKWRASSTSDPLKSVISGGALASSMAEVFMAGYQTAMRQSFGFDGPDWAAFCVSEGADGYPPVSINDDGSLSGYKTWVAAATVTQQFLLKVGRGAEARYLVLACDTPGLTIEMKPEGSFLPELGVGRLCLEQVLVGQDFKVNRAPRHEITKAFAADIRKRARIAQRQERVVCVADLAMTVGEDHRVGAVAVQTRQRQREIFGNELGAFGGFDPAQQDTIACGAEKGGVDHNGFAATFRFGG
ncbi:MAG: hypothetical protein ACPG4A_09525, partial [Pseudomonadales bacterium]